MQAIVVHNIRSISLSQTLVDNRMKAEYHLFQIYHPRPFTKCNNFDKYMEQFWQINLLTSRNASNNFGKYM